MEAALDRLTEAHEANREFTEAAHCSYRQGHLNVRLGNRGVAVAMFDRSVKVLDRVPETTRHRYFWRTLRAFYQAWRDFAALGPEALFQRRWEDCHDLLSSEAAVDCFRSSADRALTGNLLMHLEFIFEQLEIFVERLASDPTGRTTLEVCLLLERGGYSRQYEGRTIQDRIDRLLSELKKNHSRSVDVDCSFCSGVAASCLLLAGDAEHAGELLDWLRTLAWCRYSHHPQSYTDAGPTEHALYYASTVLAAFSDCEPFQSSEEDIRSVLAVILMRESAAWQ